MSLYAGIIAACSFGRCAACAWRHRLTAVPVASVALPATSGHGPMEVLLSQHGRFGHQRGRPSSQAAHLLQHSKPEPQLFPAACAGLGLAASCGHIVRCRTVVDPPWLLSWVGLEADCSTHHQSLQEMLVPQRDAWHWVIRWHQVSYNTWVTLVWPAHTRWHHRATLRYVRNSGHPSTDACGVGGPVVSTCMAIRAGSGWAAAAAVVCSVDGSWVLSWLHRAFRADRGDMTCGPC